MIIIHKIVTRQSLACHAALLYFAAVVAPSRLPGGWNLKQRNKKKTNHAKIVAAYECHENP
jgi:hypothetical protein